MKKKILDAFDTVTMPETCEERILQALRNDRKPGKAPVRWLQPVAAALAVVVLALSLSTEVRAAVSSWAVKYFFPDSDITIYEKTNDEGNTVQIVGVDTEAPAFARMVNGRLYFVGNGQKIDITDEISEESPFYYSYVDDYGLTHYMAVGISGSVENFGIYEFIREESGDWVTGTGRNFLNPETETRYPWVALVWQEWDIPWPMPE